MDPFRALKKSRQRLNEKHRVKQETFLFFIKCLLVIGLAKRTKYSRLQRRLTLGKQKRMTFLALN